MNEILQRLVTSDTLIHQFSDDNEIIKQGLAPLLTTNHSSLKLQKACLFEQSKHINWNQQAQNLFNELHERSIKFLVFKGFAFTHQLYNNTWIRPYTDIDIIISKKDYEPTVQILESLEFIQHSSRQGQFVSFQNSFYKTDSYKTTIDLHWQVNNRIEFHCHFPFDKLYNESIQLSFNSTVFRSPSIINSFIIGCFHYQAHRPEDRNHIWLYDLALLWIQMKNKNNCLQQAKETQQHHIVSIVLNRLNDVFGQLVEINQLGLQDQNEATAVYSQARKSKLTDIRIRLKNINGFSNKLKFFSEYVFQSRGYVQNRYQLKHRTYIYLYYPRMWLEDVLKLFK